MEDRFSRTRALLGDAAIGALARARVAVFGLGGVGGAVCEALVRTGVGALDLIDADRVCESNLNRQIIATVDALGLQKTEATANRMRAIAPDVALTLHARFFLPENADEFPFARYDYVVDAVDTVAAKIALAEQAARYDVPIISAMGAGNKLDPTRFRVSDISKTHTCPLARVMRRELRRRGIDRLKVVWSDEPPAHPQSVEEALRPPASVAWTPAAAGLLIASEVVKDLIRSART